MRRKFPQKEAWFNAYILQKEISTWASQLHPDLQYSKRNLYHQLVVKQQPVYIMLHALHHQCLLVLNSSLVPHFSGIAMPQDMPAEVVRVSAAVVMQSARALSDISAHVVALEWDPTQIAPFVGYCIYAAASVQMSTLPRRSSPNSPIGENLTNCMKLLKLMKPYWAVTDRLVGSTKCPCSDQHFRVGMLIRALTVDANITTLRDTNGQPQESSCHPRRGT
jgi:hypothetical protein